jgi:DNA-binding SARP family transcriptional activator
MRFEILGPLRCVGGSLDVDLSRRREGRILAALLLCRGQVVSMHRLVDLLWGENPPATARQQVQNCAAGLARLFRDRRAELPLRRTESGYQLSIRREDLDAAAFEDEVVRAGRLADAGEHRAATALLRSTIGRWRGPVLLGIDMGVFGPAAARLEELRLKAVEQLFELELGLGRHGEVVADLAEAVGATPDRERLVGQYMVALARTGRTAEALTVFHQTRRLLRQEYAIEPGRELQAIQVSILRDGSIMDTPTWPAGESVADRHRRLLDAVARAETARYELELALRGVRGLTHGARRAATARFDSVVTTPGDQAVAERF